VSLFVTATGAAALNDPGARQVFGPVAGGKLCTQDVGLAVVAEVDENVLSERDRERLRGCYEPASLSREMYQRRLAGALEKLGLQSGGVAEQLLTRPNTRVHSEINRHTGRWLDTSVKRLEGGRHLIYLLGGAAADGVRGQARVQDRGMNNPARAATRAAAVGGNGGRAVSDAHQYAEAVLAETPLEFCAEHIHVINASFFTAAPLARALPYRPDLRMFALGDEEVVPHAFNGRGCAGGVFRLLHCVPMLEKLRLDGATGEGANNAELVSELFDAHREHSEGCRLTTALQNLLTCIFMERERVPAASQVFVV
jgi:hypothetical protein